MGNDTAPYAVIADDLTGAGDAGVQFAAVGLRTRTLVGTWTEEHLRGAEVVVIDTASRGFSGAQAYSTVHAAAVRLQEPGLRVVYKKIDSTLRGAVGVEIDALLDACDLALAVVCPAYPANGRTLSQGVLLVRGVPVGETAAAADPHAPVRESHVPTLLARQTRRSVHWLGRLGAAGLATELAALRALGGQDGCIAVCDAEDDADLAAIVLAAHALDRPALLVGSAGMARPLAVLLAARRQPSVLVLCGSLHPAARSQVRYMQQIDNAGVTILTTAEQVQAAPALSEMPAAEPSALLADEARHWLDAHAVSGIVVTGGDTLHALLHALQAHGVDLDQEVAPGVPAGRIAGGPWAGLPIISKAGGFGSPTALADAVQCLKGKDTTYVC